MRRLVGTSIVVLAYLITAGHLGGCSHSGGPSSPYQTPSSAARNPLKAQTLTAQAAPLTESDPAQAESLLREALTADAFHGPAHNDLGVIQLGRGELYEAANEFEWARKLMPGHPDPRMNLALTLERAGRIDEAMASYDDALEVYPHHVPTMQALVRCQLRHARTDDRTIEMLREIAMGGQDESWRTWAHGQLTLHEGVRSHR